MRLNLRWTYVSREWNEVVSESISRNVQWAAEMICAMEVSTQVKSTLSKNHPWSMKAATKNVNEGCSNCNESYDVSIMWNEWKAASKMKFKFESGRSKHSEICDGVSIRTKSSSTSKQSEICDGSINSSKISHGSRNWNEVCDVWSTWKNENYAWKSQVRFFRAMEVSTETA